MSPWRPRHVFAKPPPAARGASRPCELCGEPGQKTLTPNPEMFGGAPACRRGVRDACWPSRRPRRASGTTRCAVSRPACVRVVSNIHSEAQRLKSMGSGVAVRSEEKGESRCGATLENSAGETQGMGGGGPRLCRTTGGEASRWDTL